MRKQLNGYVVSDADQALYDFFGFPAFSPQLVRNALEELPEGEDLVLEINSSGGSVPAGFEIYSVLRSATKPTVAEVQSIAASAASVIMLGCREVVASPVAQVMIHLPLMSTDGNRYDHIESIGILDSITEGILNAYMIKSHGLATRDEIKRMMKTSTWLTAPEAKNLGFVDRILGEETIDPNAILNWSMGVAAMPTPETLRAEYTRLVEAGKAPPLEGQAPQDAPEEAPPAHENDKLQAAVARLALEKMRF